MFADNERRRRRGAASGAGICLRTDDLAHRDHLYRCAKLLSRDGGRGPGPDGVTWEDLSRSEIGAICGHLSDVVRAGTYRHGPTRECRLPKPGGRGHRTLRIPNIVDRIVAKAVNEFFTPLWERIFSSRSYGFRPRRGTWDLLAALEADMRRTGWRVLAVDDVRKAFDSVRLEDVLECHRRALAALPRALLHPSHARRTLDLIGHVLRGQAPGRERGIDQGCPYAPPALNAVLHYYHDAMLDTKHPDLPWYRYADNVCYLVPGMPDGGRTLAEAGRLLAPLGLELKGEDGTWDLGRGDEAQLLGFTLRWDGTGLRLAPGPEAFDNLRHRLDECQDEQNPPRAAHEVVLGWVEAFAPGLEDGDVTAAVAAATDRGHREVPVSDVRRHYHSVRG